MQLTVNNLSVHCQQYGSGPELVLLHGWGYDLTLLTDFAKELAAFAHVTLIDLPGHGGTAEPDRPYTAFDFADVVAGVCDKLNITRACFMGHSNGGRTIIAMSRDHAQLFDRLVLCSAAGVRPRRGAKYYVKVYSYKLLKKLVSLPVFTDKQRQKWLSSKGSEDYKKLSPVMKGTFKQLVNCDLTPLLSTIAVPTVLIWGDGDTDTPLYMADIIKREIPDAGLCLYNGCGHYAFLQQRARTVAILRSFLGGTA